MMGGDLVITADHPLPDSYRDEARRRNLRLAETLVFPSMVMADGQAHLADIKAVSSSYPLRGKLGIQRAPGRARAGGGDRPGPGSVWLDERLVRRWNASTGTAVMVGS